MYVAVCSGAEDLLKVGLSRDPLARWSAFHPRWFEAFDLAHSVLIETETRREAQALETALHRRLLEHNCPPPSTMRAESGGGTEWYRGAYPAIVAFSQSAIAQGFVVHRPAREWFARAMHSHQATLFSVVDQALRMGSVGLSATQKKQLRDLIDAHLEFDRTLIARLPDALSAFW